MSSNHSYGNFKTSLLSTLDNIYDTDEDLDIDEVTSALRHSQRKEEDTIIPYMDSFNSQLKPGKLDTPFNSAIKSQISNYNEGIINIDSTGFDTTKHSICSLIRDNGKRQIKHDRFSAQNVNLQNEYNQIDMLQNKQICLDYSKNQDNDDNDIYKIINNVINKLGTVGSDNRIYDDRLLILKQKESVKSLHEKLSKCSSTGSLLKMKSTSSIGSFGRKMSSGIKLVGSNSAKFKSSSLTNL